jgi:hypothetical protein
MLIAKCSVKYCDHRSVSQLGCRHLSPTTPPASTSETSPVTWGFEKAKASNHKEILPLSQITQIKGFFMSYRDEANK